MSRSFLSCLAALALPLSGCVAAHSPSRLWDVESELSSVTLSDDCGGTGLVAPDCAAEDSFCGFCRQSGLQLHFTAVHVDETLPVEIVSVELLEEGGLFISNLTPRDPRTFGDEGYETWDETIAPGEELHVTYDTTAPDWSIAEGERGRATRYRVRVVVRIDGIERTLELAPVTREAEIVT